MIEEYIEHPMIESLPDHTTQLQEILRVAKNIQKKFDREKNIFPSITLEQIEAMEHVQHKCLYRVADLSMTRSEIQTNMEEHYVKTYIKNPKIGKKLYLNHYFKLHKPYDKVKDYCWKSIFNLKKFREENF